MKLCQRINAVTRRPARPSIPYRFLQVVALLLGGLGIAGRCPAQATTEIWTDRPSYDLGETIELTFKITNTGSETFTLSTYCNAPLFVFDELTLPYEACVTYTHHFVFPPGSWRSWTLPLRPNAYGLPETSGTHRLIARFAHLADTVWFEALAYPGGRLEVIVAAGADPDTLAAIRADLQATVLYTDPFHETRQRWEIYGIPLREAIAKYEGHPAIHEMVPLRFISSLTSVAIEPGAPPPVTFVSPAYPNPFTTRSTLRVQVETPQQVRVTVYDLLGRQVAVLHNGRMLPGRTYEVSLAGALLPAGRYLCRIAGETFSETRMVVRTR